MQSSQSFCKYYHSRSYENEAIREITLNKDKSPEYVIAEFATANWEKNTHTTTSAKFLSLIFLNIVLISPTLNALVKLP